MQNSNKKVEIVNDSDVDEKEISELGHAFSRTIQQQLQPQAMEKRSAGPYRGALKTLMYGFGDAGPEEQNEESVALLETYVEEFVTNLVSRSYQRTMRSGRTTVNQIRLADVLKVLEKDQKKFLRMPYIIKALRDTK